MTLEAIMRLTAFFGVFVACAVWEAARPQRRWYHPRIKHWATNLGLMLINTLVTRFTVGAVAVAAALWAQSSGFGLLQWLAPQSVFGQALAVLFALLALDLAIWFQHWLTHRWTPLWRLHRVHHTDLELDVTTALRFHPVEILLSLLFKAILVIALGIDVWVVIVFEALLSASALFNHANIRLPKAVDRVLRWVIVTPDMHRIHHSVEPNETNSNYGFFLSWWDRLFETYRVSAKDDHLTMPLGLKEYRQSDQLTLPKLLVQPWRGVE
ncbi:sterol desaturase family protein [Neptunomonas marina]|uniref:Sterol desaturase family protein n=1 Tax=Neptunomonas marina TaxID=1815562 RepID=A0A437QC49_9GAMM|nr:sterol desaturase family protein [Neptunomonas marina]RVU32114.1 sterol desaturase family protein [Neptunomonas marina]